MPANGYFQPKFISAYLAAKLANMSTDTFQVGLIASGTLAPRATTEGYEFVSDLLANGGSALAEVSPTGTGYSRQALAAPSWSLAGLTVKFTASNPSWPAATFTAEYAWIHDETASSGTDATRPLVAIYDFGGAQSVSNNPFTLLVNSAGLAYFTAAQ